MWILKGSFLGLWVFAFGTLAFLYLNVYHPERRNYAIGLSVLAGQTTFLRSAQLRFYALLSFAI